MFCLLEPVYTLMNSFTYTLRFPVILLTMNRVGTNEMRLDVVQIWKRLSGPDSGIQSQKSYQEETS